MWSSLQNLPTMLKCGSTHPGVCPKYSRRQPSYSDSWSCTVIKSVLTSFRRIDTHCFLHKYIVWYHIYAVFNVLFHIFNCLYNFRCRCTMAVVECRSLCSKSCDVRPPHETTQHGLIWQVICHGRYKRSCWEMFSYNSGLISQVLPYIQRIQTIQYFSELFGFPQ